MTKVQPSYAARALISAGVAAVVAGTFQTTSISALCAQAQVSRNSFYRHFSDKAALLRRYLTGLLATLPNQDAQGRQLPVNEQYTGLFSMIAAQREFFLALQAQGYLDLLRDALVAQVDPAALTDNRQAYAVAFVMSGTYGWIETWLRRGMQESAASMAALLRHAVKP